MTGRWRTNIGSGTRTGRKIGRVGGTLFGLVFMAFGLFFTVMLLMAGLDAVRQHGWPSTTATVLSSSFSSDGPDEHPYRFVVHYRYQVDGGTYESSTYLSGYSGDDDFAPIQRLMLRYPAGARVTCRYDPDRPARAVLKPRSPWMLALVLFPLLFVVIGAAVAIGSLRGSRAKDESLGDEATVRPKKRSRKVLSIVGGVLLLVGLGVGFALWPWMIGPVRARSWSPVTATVVSSTVRRHESTDSDGHHSITWKLDILYRYDVDGRSYLSNRYGFIGGSSSGYDGKNDIAKSLPRGSTVTAWVDPSDPTRAVLERGFTALHFLGLLPLLFVLLGAVMLRKGLVRPTDALPEAPGLPGHPTEAAAARTLEPGGGRWGKVFGMLFFCAFWNGIVSVFLWQVIQAFRHGRHPWFDVLFLTPFVLVGLATVAGFFYFLLGLANPRTTITLLVSELCLGESLRIAWRTRGRVARLRTLRFVLEGEESATYRRGTDTHTDTSTFKTITVAEVVTASQMRNGEAETVIPEDTMHTFRGQSNRITWKLRVRGEVPHWPDVDDSWELVVLPMREGEVTR